MEIKIPFYNILNMFLTGLVFLGGSSLVYPEKILQVFQNEIFTNISTGPEIMFIVCVFAVVYEIGLIINRIGSVILEPLMKRSGIIKFNDDYKLFNERKKEYPIMDILSREYALSRTGVVLFLLLMILGISAHKFTLAWIYAAIMVIYLLSCRKHSKKIADLMNN